MLAQPFSIIYSPVVFSFGYASFFLIHLVTSCYIPVVSSYK